MKVSTTLLILSCCVKSVLSQYSALQGAATFTIQCQISDVTYPGWRKAGEAAFITVTNDPDINPSFPAGSRISYASNNRDLILSNVEIGDAGSYVCSVTSPTAQSFSFNFTVEVLTVNDVVWPEQGGNFAFARISCQTGASVKWYAVVPEKNNAEKEMCVTSTQNATSCDPGKEQLSTGFDYRPGKTLKVKFKYELLHSSTGNSPQATATSDSTYKIYGCCSGAEIASYIFFGILVITTVTTLILCSMNLRELGMVGKFFIGVAGISFVIGVAWFIPLRVSVLPVLPGGEEDCLDLTKEEKCECGHPIAFAVVSSLLSCIGGTLMIYTIYRVMNPSEGGKPTATPAPPDRARGNAGGRQENGRKKETKFKPQDSPENDDTERKRPLPGPPK